jgi:glutamine cyclotransferase
MLSAFCALGFGLPESHGTLLILHRGAGYSDLVQSPPPIWTYEVIAAFPHDPSAYTQGLVYHEGALYESTGLNGRSSLRKVDLQTGKVLKSIPLSKIYFGEGLAIFQNRIFQLTWLNQTGFVYDLDTFGRVAQFSYEGEGWGLTQDGRSLILSDGTDKVRFINPASFKTERIISVGLNGRRVTNVNELEYIRGEIYANIWQQDILIRIDPATGTVLGVIDLTGLLPEKSADETDSVLNGIAYDEKKDRLFVTGKRWPKLFEIRLIKRNRQGEPSNSPAHDFTPDQGKKSGSGSSKQ